MFFPNHTDKTQRIYWIRLEQKGSVTVLHVDNHVKKRTPKNRSFFHLLRVFVCGCYYFSVQRTAEMETGFLGAVMDTDLLWVGEM